MRETAKTFPLTDDEVKILHRILRQTFDGIAHDLGECSGQTMMTRADVIETTLDANYIETRSSFRIDLVEKDIVKRFRTLSYKDQKIVAKNAFPFARYEC